MVTVQFLKVNIYNPWLVSPDGRDRDGLNARDRMAIKIAKQ